MFLGTNGMNTETKRYRVGDMLTAAEVGHYLPGLGGGWFVTDAGQRVYACDGAHKDGTSGFKVLQLDGLK